MSSSLSIAFWKNYFNFLNENDVEKYIVNPIISSDDNWDYYDEYWIKVKTPETDSNNKKVAGWYVSNVVEAGYYNDEKLRWLNSISGLEVFSPILLEMENANRRKTQIVVDGNKM